VRGNDICGIEGLPERTTVETVQYDSVSEERCVVVDDVRSLRELRVPATDEETERSTNSFLKNE
jgi:hypothetical protein